MKEEMGGVAAALIWKEPGKQKEPLLAKKTNVMNKGMELILGRFQEQRSERLFYS